jgi:cob(I)alamin adenosyltransferase
MKIYTKTGDKGETSLFSGTRLPKYHKRIEAYGTVDELNSNLGFLRDQQGLPSDLVFRLTSIQELLFTLGSNLANDGARSNVKLPVITEVHVQDLENAMDNMEAELEPMTHFILPGGHPAVSMCHIVRTVCRRAERRVVELSDCEKVDLIYVRYLNRLSDYLFVLSRHLAKFYGADEIKWMPDK